jgi:hypothetical protein
VRPARGLPGRPWGRRLGGVATTSARMARPGRAGGWAASAPRAILLPALGPPGRGPPRQLPAVRPGRRGIRAQGGGQGAVASPDTATRGGVRDGGTEVPPGRS